MCEEKFEKAVNDELSKNKFIFKHSSEKSNNNNNNDEWRDARTRGIKCAEYPLITNKHLTKNCFFTMRNSLIKRIDFFVNNEEWYNKRGIPYQLTLVFEGSPGCGKTSTMKGIATYTDRHIVDVDLTNIKSITELEDIFYGNYINGKYIPTNKRIFLIDEIDKFFEALSLKEEKEKNMAAAATENSNSNINPNNIVIVSKDGLSGDDGNKFKKTVSSTASTASNGLTRGQILSIMDGILESRGRFIICTANDTSKIDDTFKRPGRMDEIVHFSKCDALMINQLVDLFYNGCVEDAYTEEQIRRYKHIEYLFSPSDVNKVCFNNINSRELGEEYFMKVKE
jgi:SpoVK/Ycf46/Vps4 family AAA+-type ATPase